MQQFNRWVQLHVRASSGPDAAALMATFEDRGWRVARLPHPSDRDLVVDLWLNSSKFAAVGLARQAVDQATQMRHRCVVLEAALVEPRQDRLEQHRVVRLPPKSYRGWKRQLWLIVHRLVPHEPHRLAWQPPTETPSEADAEVRARLTASPLSVERFDPTRHTTRVSISGRIAQDEPAKRPVGRRFLVVLLGLPTGGAAGYSLQQGSWVALALGLASVVLAFPVGNWFSDNRPRVPQQRWAIGMSLVVSFAALGWLLRATLPDFEPRWTGLMALLAAAGCAIYGLRHFRSTWLGKHFILLVPLIGSILVVVRATAYLMLAVYAQDFFGVPIREVARDPLLDVALAAEPVAILIVVTLALGGLAGWGVYWGFHVQLPVGYALMAVLLIALYAMSVLVFSVNESTVAARSAQAQARDHRQPEAWRLVEVKRVCVQPLTPQPSTSGTLVVVRPVIEIPTSGDRLWVWDPESVDARLATVNVLRDQVRTSPAEDGQLSCPQA